MGSLKLSKDKRYNKPIIIVQRTRRKYDYSIANNWIFQVFFFIFNYKFPIYIFEREQIACLAQRLSWNGSNILQVTSVN